MTATRFTLNGKETESDAHPMARLLDVLREDLGYTGTKEGCGEGECGACTVLVDGAPVCSCIVPFSQVEGAKVETIEGLGGDHQLQHAFMNEVGAQCGICTPGMIMAALKLGPNPTLDEIRVALAGNLCRCTGYSAIYRAIQSCRPERSEGPAPVDKQVLRAACPEERQRRRAQDDRGA